MLNIRSIRALDKYYNLTKILLTLSPFVCISYLYINSIKAGSSIQSIIEANPRFVILFLSSMINPFIAYLLIFMQRKIKNGDIQYAVTNLFMLMLSELMFQNIIYIFLIGFILYKTLKTYNISIKDSFKKKIKDKFFLSISGSIVVMFFACICLFATIRISVN